MQFSRVPPEDHSPPLFKAVPEAARLRHDYAPADTLLRCLEAGSGQAPRVVARSAYGPLRAPMHISGTARRGCPPRPRRAGVGRGSRSAGWCRHPSARAGTEPEGSPRPTRTVATECRSRCKVTSGIPAAAHSWANQCPSPPVVNRLPWLGSAENNHGPNRSLPDLALHAWTLPCHKSVLVSPTSGAAPFWSWSAQSPHRMRPAQ